MTETPRDPDQLLSLADAARIVPTAGGKPPSTMTLYRWTRGVRGVTLKSLRFGRRIVIRYRDLLEFAEELAVTYEPVAPERPTHGPKPRTETQRERAIKAAEARLRARGCMPEK